MIRMISLRSSKNGKTTRALENTHGMSGARNVAPQETNRTRRSLGLMR